jgi:predicted nucleotide-binding protein (sugar kinase/HSP70/actin superfamily)
MKQTAVEWLAETLRFANKELYAEIYEHIEQAKEMEKEQMVDAWSDGWLNDYEYDKDVKNSAEQYYNETFNTNEK